VNLHRCENLRSCIMMGRVYCLKYIDKTWLSGDAKCLINYNITNLGTAHNLERIQYTWSFGGYDNGWFIILIFGWTMPIIWGTYIWHDVSAVRSTSIFRWLVAITLILLISGDGSDRTRDLLNVRLVRQPLVKPL
jgi:hypothetical protein